MIPVLDTVIYLVNKRGTLPMLCAHEGNSLYILCCWGDESSGETSLPL